MTDVDLLQTMDARVWAKEFCRITGFTDEEWAVTWFANAIMCGWDHHHWTTPEYKAQIAAVLGDNRHPADDAGRGVGQTGDGVTP